MKVITVNKQAKFEYFVEETFEAGIVLEGSEVKSLRMGNCSLQDSFCFVRDGEAMLKNMHIAFYEKSAAFSTRDTRRDRKLLLNKYEINKIVGKINEKGYTLIPLKLYFKDALVKVELGLCKGKHVYDKKKSIRERDLQREAERELKNYR